MDIHENMWFFPSIKYYNLQNQMYQGPSVEVFDSMI